MTDPNRATAIRWFEEWWNKRSDTIIDEVTTPDCRAMNEGVDGELDRNGMREHRRAWLSAVPDVRMELLSVTSNEETVIVHWRALGTHTGPGIGIPPSGRAVNVTGFTALTFEQGRIARGVDSWNRGELIASLMQVRLDELCANTALTPREAQVALMMADRLSHTEIAEDLGISANTARRHCESVLRKLGVSRKQDVAAALGAIPASVLVRHGSDL
ncbi:MAG: ester cyclase [Gemmatimonadaceae bacterium]|nr:ester cyclase [Gemmatimonadaceae bacterium]